MAPITRFGIDAFKAINPWGMSTLQDSVSPGLADSYRSEASMGGGHYSNYRDFSGIGDKSESDRSAISAANGYGGGV